MIREFSLARVHTLGEVNDMWVNTDEFHVMLPKSLQATRYTAAMWYETGLSSEYDPRMEPLIVNPCTPSYFPK